MTSHEQILHDDTAEKAQLWDMQQRHIS